jgi:hypothetical protein
MQLSGQNKKIANHEIIKSLLPADIPLLSRFSCKLPTKFMQMWKLRGIGSARRLAGEGGRWRRHIDVQNGSNGANAECSGCDGCMGLTAQSMGMHPGLVSSDAAP